MDQSEVGKPLCSEWKYTASINLTQILTKYKFWFIYKQRDYNYNGFVSDSFALECLQLSLGGENTNTKMPL